MATYIDVILPLPVKQFFTYVVSEEEYAFLQPGMRLAVPFGRSKVYTALAYKFHQTAPTTYEPKSILAILDAKPIVTEVQLKHWEWVASYYMCSLGSVFKSAVPAAYLLEGETHIIMHPEALNKMPQPTISHASKLILSALSSGEMYTIQSLSKEIGIQNIFSPLEELLGLHLVKLEESLQAKYKPKYRNEYELAPLHKSEDKEIVKALKRAPKQLELYRFFLRVNMEETVTDALLKERDFSPSALRSLVEKEIVIQKSKRIDRVVFDHSKTIQPLKILNVEQQQALEGIESGFAKGRVCLLHGVTASGKTEVFAALIQKAIKQGKQALYLLPEIALTTQLIKRLQLYFGAQVAVFHSKYSLQERVEVWRQVLESSSKAKLIVGARSALFLPFNNLGLIVVDEEHEASFKQYDPAPRYHARDAAVVLAKLSKASIVLGSATPSLESLYNTISGKYHLSTLSTRHSDIQMPDIKLVDLKEQYKKKKMKYHFSEVLFLAIEEALQLGEQVILFQNRRGYAPVVECFTCGHTPHCTACDVSLTFHSNKGVLRCHYCGLEELKKNHCVSCGSLEINTKGFGTEQVQEALGILFPEAKVARMDLDTTRTKNAYQQIIDSFENQEIDILVGTQMLSKGLDFRNISLVGVMSADSLLNFPDFRAHEKTFQLLTQVAGRAGRTSKRGKVLIQSFNPHHEILQQVTQHDYKGMSKEQLYQREIYKYPPYNKLIKITLKHKDYNKLNQAAEWYAKGLRNLFPVGVLGPEFPAVARIRNLYLKNILLKIPVEISIQATKKALSRLERSFEAIPAYKGVRLIFVVDPY
ncbi:primosomal protein N' [Flavobacteriaceae bacterium LSUCC0859]|nr:primosomal protein N' [Flavobacteriaceae bacterium LSUCC0859]